MTQGGYVPERGDVVWLDFDPALGHEQRGRRPALILTRGRYNRQTGLALVCPITSRSKGYDTEVRLPVGLPIGGVALADHTRNVAWAERRAVHACTMPADVVDAVRDAIDALTDEQP